MGKGPRPRRQPASAGCLRFLGALLGSFFLVFQMGFSGMLFSRFAAAFLRGILKNVRQPGRRAPGGRCGIFCRRPPGRVFCCRNPLFPFPLDRFSPHCAEAFRPAKGGRAFCAAHHMDNTILSTQNACFLGRIHYPDFAVAAGQVTFLTGPSGCGKSSLLRLFNGTASPSAGQVTALGRNVADWDPVDLRRRVLLCGQNAFLFDGTLAENFSRYGAMRRQSAPTGAQMRRFLDLTCLPMDPAADCCTLSGGERQRAFLSIFLSFAPQVVLLDEPTSALDSATAGHFFENLTHWCQTDGVTPVVVSHDAALCRRWADRVIALTGGAGV